jgi:hypothetical protein
MLKVSDLNYFEITTEASKVHGGNLGQIGVARQINGVRAGGGRGINIGNTAIGLNINIPVLTSIPVLSSFN